MFTVAAAPLRIPKALTMGGGIRSCGWFILKFSNDRSVCAPQYLLEATCTSPKASVSVLVDCLNTCISAYSREAQLCSIGPMGHKLFHSPCWCAVSGSDCRGRGRWLEGSVSEELLEAVDRFVMRRGLIERALCSRRRRYKSSTRGRLPLSVRQTTPMNWKAGSLPRQKDMDDKATELRFFPIPNISAFFLRYHGKNVTAALEV